MKLLPYYVEHDDGTGISNRLSPRSTGTDALLLDFLKHHGEENGCHVVDVDPRETTKECAAYGVSTRKPVWMREHSCPSCGFELERDWNAAWSVLS